MALRCVSPVQAISPGFTPRLAIQGATITPAGNKNLENSKQEIMRIEKLFRQSMASAPKARPLMGRNFLDANRLKFDGAPHALAQKAQRIYVTTRSAWLS